MLAAHFSARHKEAPVGFFHDIFRGHGTGEAGPSGPGIEFINFYLVSNKVKTSAFRRIDLSLDIC